MNTNRNADVVETAFLTPSVEAITEFSVETNGFKPEFGQAGGGAITFASKSGTNTFHGSRLQLPPQRRVGREGILRGDERASTARTISARPWAGRCRSRACTTAQNKTFFFAAYEGFRNNQASNALTLSVPTPEMYDGDFSNWVDSQGRLLVIYDPATTRPNPERNRLHQGSLPGQPDSRQPVQHRREAIPRAGADRRSCRTGRGSCRARSATCRTTFCLPAGRRKKTTHKYQPEDRSRAQQRASPVVPLQPDEQRRGARGRRRGRTSGAVQHVSIIELRRGPSPGKLGLDHRAAHGESPERWREHVQQECVLAERRSELERQRICIPNAVDCNQNFGIISFSEFATWGGSSYNGTEQPRFSIKDDLTISKGSHTIKAGFTFDRQQANGFGQQDLGGRAGFSFLETGIPGATTLANGGGNSFASFLLGAADTGRTETIRYLQQIYPYYGFYAQDDWRMNDKLVLNYGLRYEFTQPPRAGGDQYSDLSPTKPNPAVNNYPGALVFAGDGPGREGTSSLFPGYYGALAPRVSFAYSAERQDDRSRRRRPIVRTRDGRPGQQSLRRVHRSVRVLVGRCRRHARVQSGSGSAGLSAAAADRSGVLEQQRRGLVQRSGGQPSGAVRQLDDFGSA